MTRKNIVVSLIILLVFIMSALIVLPLDNGILFSRGVELGLDLQGGLRIVYEADLSGVTDGNKDEILQGVVKVITNRINPLGVSEPQIGKQGDDRIVVSLPGLSNSDTEKDRIGRTALLEFREYKSVDGEMQWVAATGEIDGVEKILNSSYFKENTYAATDNFGRIVLVFEFNAEGAKLSEQITRRLI